MQLFILARRDGDQGGRGPGGRQGFARINHPRPRPEPEPAPSPPAPPLHPAPLPVKPTPRPAPLKPPKTGRPTSFLPGVYPASARWNLTLPLPPPPLPYPLPPSPPAGRMIAGPGYNSTPPILRRDQCLYAFDAGWSDHSGPGPAIG